MCSNELTLAITSIGIGIAQDKSNDELALLAAIFMQLSDVLGVIAANNTFFSDSKEKEPDEQALFNAD